MHVDGMKKSSFSFSGGTVIVSADTSKGFYHPGDKIPVEIQVKNDSGSSLRKGTVTLVQKWKKRCEKSMKDLDVVIQVCLFQLRGIVVVVSCLVVVVFV